MNFFRKKRFYAILLIVFLGVWFLNADFIGRLIYPVHYKQDIIATSEQYKIEPYWMMAIIRVESNFRSDRISSKGATGIMQIMPETAKWIAEQGKEFSSSSSDMLTVPIINIRMGGWYLRYLVDFFEGYVQRTGILDERDRLAIVAASYNAGQGTVQNWLTSGQWDGTLNNSRMIPYDETRHYVQRVDYYYRKYKNLYDDL